MRIRIGLVVVVLIVGALMIGCGDDDGAASTQAPSTTATTTITTTTAATTTIATTTTTTSTTMPAVEAAPELILVAPNVHTGNLRLEVLEGEYQLTTGATLWAGSNLIDVPEDVLRFYEGLRIDVAEEVTLRGVVLPTGSEWIVNAAGEVVER